VLSRFAARAVTGPLAFFVAGVIDVALLLVLYARWRMAQRRQAGATTRPS
jgi:hypothetical protein